MTISTKEVSITLNRDEIEALKLMSELFMNLSIQDIVKIAQDRGSVVKTRDDATLLAKTIQMI